MSAGFTPGPWAVNPFNARAGARMIRLIIAVLSLSACAPSLCGKPYTASEDRAGVEHQCDNNEKKT